MQKSRVMNARKIHKLLGRVNFGAHQAIASHLCFDDHHRRLFFYAMLMNTKMVYFRLSRLSPEARRKHQKNRSSK